MLLMMAYAGIAQQTAKVSPKGTKFLLYTPPNYSTSSTHPLLIVLHGQGGMGDNLNLLLNKDDIPSRLINENRWPAYPFIVVSPQMKRDPSVPVAADQEWPPEMVDEVVEYVRANYSVNPNKIYITGLSQGSHGSYNYTATYPHKIAAAVYISGAPDSTIACQIKDVPIRVFHGTDDSLVPPVLAKGLIRALNSCSPPGKFRPHLTMLTGRRHEGWNEIYNNSSGFNIFEWMLKFTKNSSSNTAPYANAGKDITVAVRQQPLHLYGDVFDSDGSIASVRWTKTSGPAITMAQADSRFLKLSDLAAGTFEFELTATDDDGAQTKDRVRVTIVSQNSVTPAVTGLTLLNGITNPQQVIASLYDGYVLNPKTQSRAINIEASVTGSVGSVRFTVNGDQNARITNTSPYPLATPRWTPDGGEYVVCATPYTGADGTGSPGVSLCFKLVVSTTATQTPPPTEEPPVEEPPVEEPPVEEPPVEEPPVEEPPVEEPPVEEPPVEEPPVEEPPVEEPPVEEPPVEEPPVEEPPVEEPPVEEPPVEEPPVEEPPVEEPPVEEPPVEEPPVQQPPVVEPPVNELPDDPVTEIFERPQPDVSLYPNPAVEVVHIELPGGITDRLYYSVVNNIGERIADGEWQAGPGHEVDVRNLSEGIYILTVRGTGWQFRQKFFVGRR
jgi:predicted esterase